MLSIFRRERRLAAAPDLQILDRTPVDRLFEAAGLGLILVDASTGRVSRLNDTARARFGYAFEHPADLRVERLLPDLAVALATRAKRPNFSAPLALRATPRVGAEFQVEVTLMRLHVPDAAEPHLLLMVRDRAAAPVAPPVALLPRPAALAA